MYLLREYYFKSYLGILLLNCFITLTKLNAKKCVKSIGSNPIVMPSIEWRNLIKSVYLLREYFMGHKNGLNGQKWLPLFQSVLTWGNLLYLVCEIPNLIMQIHICLSFTFSPIFSSVFCAINIFTLAINFAVFG